MSNLAYSCQISHKIRIDGFYRILHTLPVMDCLSIHVSQRRENVLVASANLHNPALPSEALHKSCKGPCCREVDSGHVAKVNDNSTVFGDGCEVMSEVLNPREGKVCLRGEEGVRVLFCDLDFRFGLLVEQES